MDEVELLENERIELLDGGFGLVVSPEHGFGEDALLLARFAAPRKRDLACDLGAGCGIIPLLWCRDGLCSGITAVEVSQMACGQLLRTARANHLEEKLFPVCADLRELGGVLPKGKYDLVTANPPYNAKGTGPRSRKEHAEIARHETLCTLDEIAACAGPLLRFGGRFCACSRPDRLVELFLCMRRHGMEPKRLRLVCVRPTAAPRLCLVEGRRGGKSGLKIENSLFTGPKGNAV